MVSWTKVIVRLVMSTMSGRAVVTRISFGMVEGVLLFSSTLRPGRSANTRASGSPDLMPSTRTFRALLCLQAYLPSDPSSVILGSWETEMADRKVSLALVWSSEIDGMSMTLG